MSGYTGIVDATPGFVAGTFDAQDVRLSAHGNATPGLYAKGDFTVTQRAAGANMSVDIAAGRAFLEPGGPASQQGVYLARRETSYNTSSDGGYTWTAADATNPRIDLLCIEVADADEGGSFTGFKFRIVDGTPNASATHQLATTYWPAVPNYVVPIAAIKIPATDTTISTAEISNLDAVGGGRSAYLTTDTAETTTSAPFARVATPDFVCVYVPHSSAVVRVFMEGHWKNSGANTGSLGFYVNDTLLKTHNFQNAAPASGQYNLASMATLYSRFVTSPSRTASLSNQFFSSGAGVTADVTDVTTGVSGYLSTDVASSIEIRQLAAGWYVIECRYATNAGTLTVKSRNLRAQVVG